VAAGSRERLLCAVGAVLRRDGLSKLSLRAVGREAGVSHALPGVIFGDKAGMLTAWAAEGFWALGAAMELALQEEAAGPEQLAATGRAYVRFAVEDPERFRLMFRQDLLRTDLPEYRAAVEAGFAPLKAALSQCVDDGGLGAAERVVAGASAWAMVHGLAQLWIDGHLLTRGRSDPEPLILSATRTFAWRVCGGGLSPPPRPAPQPAVLPENGVE
jgi:AcrR family transcriptional regulator